MSAAYDFDTAETKPPNRTFGVGFPTLQPILPQQEVWPGQHAVYDPVLGGISYRPEDVYTFQAQPLPPAHPPSFVTGGSTLTLPGHNVCLVYATHFPSGVIPAVTAQDIVYHGAGTIGTVTWTTLSNTTSNTISTTTAQHDPLSGYAQYAIANWDGYGALPITPQTVAAARTFLRAMPRIYGDPDIAPGADGTIGLEWYFSNRPIRKLFIDIGPGGVWKGFCRKTSGEHELLPERTIGRDMAHELARLFKTLEA